jgi:uncharacterized membrane protein
MRPPPHPSAHAMAFVLRAGTTISTALLALGMAVTLGMPHARAGQQLLTGGLIILMMTPVAHLLVALADEIAAREWGFVAAGLAVLLLLCGSVVVAFS